jgi:hypothetical protein
MRKLVPTYLLAVAASLWLAPAEAQFAAPSNMLTAAGFVAKYPDTPEKQEILNSLPPNRLVRRGRNGRSTTSTPILADADVPTWARLTPTRAIGTAVSAIVTTTIASYPR